MVQVAVQQQCGTLPMLLNVFGLGCGLPVSCLRTPSKKIFLFENGFEHDSFRQNLSDVLTTKQESLSSHEADLGHRMFRQVAGLEVMLSRLSLNRLAGHSPDRTSCVGLEFSKNFFVRD